MRQSKEQFVPDALINGHGVPEFGVYYRPFANVNLADFDYRRVAPFPFRLFAGSSRRAIKSSITRIKSLPREAASDFQKFTVAKCSAK